MINLPSVRAQLKTIYQDHFTDRLTVHQSTLSAVADFPLIAIGVPRWQPNTGPCMDLCTLPVANAVRLPNDDGEVVQQELEALWAETVELMREERKIDPTLGGLVKAWNLARAEYGALHIQGRDYPAMVTEINLHA